MNLDILISVGNWLYEKSPAQYVSKEKNAILVYGESDLADALFDMLFTTTFLPSLTINLVRVSANAEEKMDRFLSRNADTLEYFAKTQMSDDQLQRPLAIHFLDAHSDWRFFRYAYAIVPEGTALEEKAGRIVCLNDIPVLHSAGDTWSSADEDSVPVLSVTRKVHTAYTLGWNDRYREEDIDRDLYGSLTGDKKEDYMLRSSLRLSVSIPWKLAIAGASNADELYQRLNNKKLTVEGRRIKDYLAWQEHRSWQAFMTLDGWRMPQAGEMTDYLFRNGNDHREKNRKLHPCLCDLTADDWFSNKKALRDYMPSEWSGLYRDALNDFPLLDQVSLRIHHQCKQIISQETYRDEMQEAFRALEHTLMSCYPPRVDIHFEHLRLAEKMFNRLLNNEANSYHPYEHACRRFIQELRQISNATNCDIRDIENAFSAVQKKAAAAVERNKYCDYKAIDANIIDWLPWIIAETDVDTIWKFCSAENTFTNLMSSIILRPRRLVLICQERDLSKKTLEIYRSILVQHGLSDIIVASINVSDLDEGQLPIDTMLSQNVIDAGEATDEMENSVIVPQGVKVVYFLKGKLRDRIGVAACAKYYPSQIEIVVDEVLQIKGKLSLSMEENNDMLGMEEDYLQLWRLCTELKPKGMWHKVISLLQKAELAIRLPIYRDKGRAEQILTFSLSSGGYERLIRNGGLRALYDLQKQKALSRLFIDSINNELSMTMFPHEVNGDMDYTDSQKTLSAIISEAADQSQFAVDVGYVAKNAPVGVYDLNEEIGISSPDEAESEALEKLVKEGLLIKRDNFTNYTYKTVAVRHGLAEEGFPLEAYVYYTLFLSGRFNDVRSNVRVMTEKKDYITLEKEIDVLVIRNGVLGIISCKDTGDIKKEHIIELAEQAKMYGTKAKPILVCSHYNMDGRPGKKYLKTLGDDIIEQCELRGVSLVGYDALDPAQDKAKESGNKLVDSIYNIIS